MDTSTELRDVSDEAPVDINKYRKLISDFINLVSFLLNKSI